MQKVIVHIKTIEGVTTTISAYGSLKRLSEDEILIYRGKEINLRSLRRYFKLGGKQLTGDNFIISEQTIKRSKNES